MVRAPKSVTVVPSQTELCTTLGSEVACSSSRVTLSPPSLAQTAASENLEAWPWTGQLPAPTTTPTTAAPPACRERKPDGRGMLAPASALPRTGAADCAGQDGEGVPEPSSTSWCCTTKRGLSGELLAHPPRVFWMALLACLLKASVGSQTVPGFSHSIVAQDSRS